MGYNKARPEQIPTAREIAEAGGPVASCPVDRRACLAELCDPAYERTLGACLKIRGEIERREYLASKRTDLT